MLTSHDRSTLETDANQTAGSCINLSADTPPSAHTMRGRPHCEHSLGRHVDLDHMLERRRERTAAHRLVISRTPDSARSAANFKCVGRDVHISSIKPETGASASARARYKRRFPSDRTVTSPASWSTFRCCDTAGRLIAGNAEARSPALDSASRTRRSRPRRVRSASAPATRSISSCARSLAM